MQSVKRSDQHAKSSCYYRAMREDLKHELPSKLHLEQMSERVFDMWFETSWIIYATKFDKSHIIAMVIEGIFFVR